MSGSSVGAGLGWVLPSCPTSCAERFCSGRPMMQQGGSCSELVAQLSPTQHLCSYFQLVTDQDPVLLEVSIKRNDVLFPVLS